METTTGTAEDDVNNYWPDDPEEEPHYDDYG